MISICGNDSKTSIKSNINISHPRTYSLSIRCHCKSYLNSGCKSKFYEKIDEILKIRVSSLLDRKNCTGHIAVKVLVDWATHCCQF